MSDIVTRNLEEARAKAKELGISCHPNTGVLKLNQLINAKEAEIKTEANENKDTDKNVENSEDSVKVSPADFKLPGPADVSQTGFDGSEPEQEEEATKPVKKETRAEELGRKRLDQLKLVRVVIHCNNDQKQDLNGETFKVANRVVGSITKFIPFDNDVGYHIPQIMLNTLNDKMCQKFKTVKRVTGEVVKMPFMVREYTITVLDPLTEEELQDLAADQKSRGAID